YIEYRVSDSACNAGLFEFIPNLCKNQNFNIIDSISLSSKLSKFRDINGNELMPLDEADFYILIYWTVWTGKLNKDHVKIWEQLATNNTDCKIKVLKVNLDLQEHWSSEKLDQYIRLFK
ncbi:MAG: hypothetical protein GX879_00885, partial [Bacteroidales bacterium]|nr:hypothetical protein [Bacteroidales bacterium]